jgi:glycosyltransferase involved in cell wall biosynthesis
MARHRIGVTMYGPLPGGRVSGLTRFQDRLRAILEAAGHEVVPIYFTATESAPAPGPAIPVNRRERRFYLPEEARAAGLAYPDACARTSERCLALFRRERIDALHVVEWMPTGMALWDAALRWGGPVAFTPTEHGAVCQYGFLLHPCGAACEGPGDGARCGACTHGLEPYPPPAEPHPWYSRRHRALHRLTRPLPEPLRRSALWALADRLQPGRVAIGEDEGRARLASARRVLDRAGTVAFQSPHQRRVFERAVGGSLAARLPLVMPIPPEPPFDGKEVDAETTPVTFLFAARPNFDRGLWLLLDAWERWAPPARRARLLLHTHDDGSGLPRRVAALRERGCAVELAFGLLGPERLREVHRSVHFVVNPAVWEEPGSSTVIEGLFLGTPAIVPTETGSADLIEPGRNGYRYRFRDPADLAATLRAAADDVASWPLLHAGALESASVYRRASELHVRGLLERLLGRS